MVKPLLALLSAGSMVCMPLVFNCSKTPTNTASSSTSTDFNSGGTAGSNGSASNPSGISTLPTAAQQSAAEVATEQGSASLESALYSVSSPQSLNVGAANLAFKSAIAQNPNNTRAQFGAAVTELITINQDPTISAVLDSFTVTPPTTLFKSRLLGLSIAGSSFKKSGAILSEIASAQQGAFPKISAIQGIVKDSLLPEIVYALDRLSIIENDPSFDFKITPKMRGIAVGDTFDLEGGEVYVIDAGLRVVRGILLSLIAYNVDIDVNGSYQWTNSGDEYQIASNLKRLYLSSQFLALNSWGGDAMKSSIANMRESIGKLQSAVTFIQGESSQGNHIIKVADLNSANSQLSSDGGTITSITNLLDTASRILAGPYTFTSDGQSLTVNVSAVFDAPIIDLKSKLPYIKWRDSSEWDSGGTFQPVYCVTSTGTVVPDSDVQFPDYTLGGLFPQMTTRQEWRTYIQNMDGNPLEQTAPTTYTGCLCFPFASVLH